MVSLARLLPRLHRRTLQSFSTFPRVETHFQQPFSGTHQNRYALQLSNLQQFLPCITIAAEMKQKRVKPNLPVYNAMLATAAEEGLWLEALAILDDMLYMGIRPNAMSFNHLLHAVRFKHSQLISRVLVKMDACGIKPNSQTITLIISRCAAEGNLEMAIRHLLSFSEQGITPGLEAVQSVILLVARNNFVRLALDLAEWFERISVRRLEETIWVECLIAAAETAYPEGIERCWKIVNKKFRTLLDEGTCTAIMNTAARNGLPGLATEVLKMLQTISVSPQEHHFAAIIEAFCKRDQVKEAILVLDLMASSGIESSLGTAEPIAECIQHSAKKIDAAWNQVKQLHQEDRHLHVSIYQTIIMAAVSNGDLTKAIAFCRALPDFGHSPSVDLYNHLIRGCTHSANRQVGDELLSKMKLAKLKPNRETYENFIRLCLTQDVYEDAFFYLEEMKAAKHKPSSSIYTAIIEKCRSSDDKRYRIALQEMKECKYIIPASLQNHLEIEEKQEDAAPSIRPLSEDEQRFIERGGLV